MNKQALLGKKIAFIGAGSMAEAIIRGVIQQEIANRGDICVTNRSNREQLEALSERYGVSAVSEPEQKEKAIRNADIVVIAMKPKDVKQAFAGFSEWLHAGQLIVSVVAGLSLETIALLVPKGMPVARTMPNTSSTIGMGATGICFSEDVTSDLKALVLEMFHAIGEVNVVPEQLINAVTGISGSGPAYAYYFMEALIEAGIEAGLEPETARDLTVQTVLGAAAMVKTTQEDPAVLRRKVTSPNGTTQAAIEVFDHYDFRQTLAAGVKRCIERAAEIGEQIGADVREGKEQSTAHAK